MDFDSLKYAELRSLAKDLGLKANMKAEKLLKAIKQHYQQEKKESEEQRPESNDARNDENEAQDKNENVQDSSCKEDVSNTAGFVNTRRGKRNGTKRKISDTATLTKSNAEIPPNAAEGDADIDASSAPCRARGAKKRKVSSHKDTDKTAKEPPKNLQTTDIKDEAPVTGAAEKAAKVAKAGKIPRLQQKTKPLLKPVTPNFKKLHEAHFNKMESIDSYVQRKTKQLESYRSSVKELKNLSDKTNLQQVDGKIQVKATATRASMFSPAPMNKTPGGEAHRHTLLSATKKPILAKEGVPFRPSVLSTRRINVRFSEATRDNEYKRSLVKTPARMSPCVTSSTPQKQTADGLKPSSVKTAVFSATKTSGPFIFTGNTSTSTTPGTHKKPSFDLKASLSRPLNYKPHKGKLQPFGEVKENAAMNKSVNSNTHQEAYKQRKVQSRDDRRTKQTQDRKQKKESMLGARRGLVMT